MVADERAAGEGGGGVSDLAEAIRGEHRTRGQDRDQQRKAQNNPRASLGGGQLPPPLRNNENWASAPFALSC